MNGALPFLLIPLLPAFLLLSGYALAARIALSSPTERLATALLAGLALLLLTLSVVNFFAPLDSLRAWLCLWPVALTLTNRTLVTRLRDDLAAALRSPPVRVATAFGTAILLLIVWPELSRPELMFYDGTSSHDGYFWIAGAKYLQAHSYMEIPPIDAAHPWANLVRAITGWQPEWGRAGAESLLALCASLLFLDPVHVYLPATAALLPCWIAAVYLVTRTFWLNHLTRLTAIALVALPSLFVFYRANANLPNLLGALTAAAAIVATAQNLRADTPRWPWLILLALSVHGTFFAYPEIAPFTALVGGLLLARALWSTPARVWPPCLALLAGLAVNPATSLRALHGLAHSFQVARANADWADTFERIRWPQYPPALATLSLPTAKFFGPLLSGIASVLLIAAVILALRCARDRYGAAATLSGCIALLTYTLITDFAYGWQKSIQFAGPFVAALLPVAAIGLYRSRRPFANWRHTVETLLAGAVALLFAIAMVFHFLETYKWSSRRFISRDWADLQDFARTSFRDVGIRIEPATFPMSFFHGMWATYFLPDTPLSFSPRGQRQGGYLHETVLTAPALPSASSASSPAILVSRAWADTVDANSPRLLTSETFTLLSTANHVVSLSGFTPDEGLPEFLSSPSHLEILPHSRSELHLALTPEVPGLSSAIEWRVTSTAAAPANTTTLTGTSTPTAAGAWNLVVPLAAGQLHRIEFTIRPATDPSTPMPRLKIAALRVVTLP